MHTRIQAEALLKEWTKTDTLLKHARSVEASMRAHARLSGEDEELWGNTGLLHDFDYERNPDPKDHPRIGMAYLEKEGWPAEMIQAIGGHALYLEIPRETQLAKTLFAVDELSGLIMAVAYTRPLRTLAEVTVPAVLKKMKDKGFARGVNREDIYLGVKELGITLDGHIGVCLMALQDCAEDLGL
jgi:putative nucleotidyltransferase with HDIG domain